jgi:hypothetical protein
MIIRTQKYSVFERHRIGRTGKAVSALPVQGWWRTFRTAGCDLGGINILIYVSVCTMWFSWWMLV